MGRNALKVGIELRDLVLPRWTRTNFEIPTFLSVPRINPAIKGWML